MSMDTDQLRAILLSAYEADSAAIHLGDAELARLVVSDLRLARQTAAARGESCRRYAAALADKERELTSARQDLGLSEIAARQAKELLASCERALSERDDTLKLAKAALSTAWDDNCDLESNILNLYEARDAAWMEADALRKERDSLRAQLAAKDVEAGRLRDCGKPGTSPLDPACGKCMRCLSRLAEDAEDRAECGRNARKENKYLRARLSECEPVIEAARRLQGTTYALAHQDALNELHTIPLPPKVTP